MTNGRSIDMISSYSLFTGHLNNSISLPTVSVESFLGAPMCFLVTESAAGCMVSLRCKDIVTREMLTGAVIPAFGRISTVPSIRGCQECQQSPLNVCACRTHESSRNARISDQEIRVRTSRHSHECAHLLRKHLARPRSSGKGVDVVVVQEVCLCRNPVPSLGDE